MPENPYEPPSPSRLPAADETDKPRWYDSPIAEWERTASVSWITGVCGMLWAGFVPMPSQFVDSVSIPDWIPGPEVIGAFGYACSTAVLALLPTVLCAMLHCAAMQLSDQPWYRRFLKYLAALLGILLTVVICFCSQFVMIR